VSLWDYVFEKLPDGWTPQQVAEIYYEVAICDERVSFVCAPGL